MHFWHPDMEQPKIYEKKTEQIPIKPEKQRPKLQLLGHDGNIFSIMGDASTLLKKNKQTAEAKEMCKRVLESGGLLQSTFDYQRICGNRVESATKRK